MVHVVEGDFWRGADTFQTERANQLRFPNVRGTMTVCVSNQNLLLIVNLSRIDTKRQILLKLEHLNQLLFKHLINI